jgi:hypothetical protein
LAQIFASTITALSAAVQTLAPEVQAPVLDGQTIRLALEGGVTLTAVIHAKQRSIEIILQTQDVTITAKLDAQTGLIRAASVERGGQKVPFFEASDAVLGIGPVLASLEKALGQKEATSVLLEALTSLAKSGKLSQSSDLAETLKSELRAHILSHGAEKVLSQAALAPNDRQAVKEVVITMILAVKSDPRVSAGEELTSTTLIVDSQLDDRVDSTAYVQRIEKTINRISKLAGYTMPVTVMSIDLSSESDVKKLDKANTNLQTIRFITNRESSKRLLLAVFNGRAIVIDRHIGKVLAVILPAFLTQQGLSDRAQVLRSEAAAGGGQLSVSLDSSEQSADLMDEVFGSIQESDIEY